MAKITLSGLLVIGISYPLIYYHFVYSHHLSYDQLQQKVSLYGEIKRIDDYQHSLRLTVKPTRLAGEAIPSYKVLAVHIFLNKTYLADKPVPRLADKLYTEIKLKPIETVLNRGLFDRRLHYFYHGLKYKGSINSKSRFKLIPKQSTPALENLLSQSDYAWVYQGVLLGQSHKIPSNVKSAIRQLGIAHLFAVSGLHMAIMFGLCYWLAKLFSFILCLALPLTFFQKRILTCFIAIIGCAYYLHLAQYSTSATRAFLMVTTACSCLICFRHYTSWRALMLALISILVMNPFVVLSIGFYFSFIAVSAILATLTRLKKHRLSQPFVQLIALQCAITLALLPLSALFFNGISMVSMIVNLIAVPLFSFLIMPLMLCVLVCAGVLGTDIFIRLFDNVLAMLVDIILMVPKDSFWLYLPSVSWQLVVVTITALIMACYHIKSSYISLPVITIYLLTPLNNNNNLTIHVLDVGHGLSVIIEKSGEAVLYDLAASYQNFSYFNAVIYPSLKQHKLILKSTVISHKDNDHSGGYNDLTAKSLGDTLRGYGTDCEFDAFWLENVRFQSIKASNVYRSENNNSCVVLVTYQQFRFLLTGDIEFERESALINHALIADVDVMISAHHGSNTSSTHAFIEHTHPSWVIHSVNRYNRWALPHKDVIARYSQLGSRQISTQMGAITIAVTGPTFTINSERGTRRYWFLRH